MPFTHDTEATLIATAELINTRQPDVDELTTPAELDAFYARHDYTGRRDHTDAELRAVRALRPRLRALWHADRDDLAGLVNELLAEHRALPQLVRHDHWDWHLHATEETAPLATRLAVEAAMALVDVIRADELDRLRHCAADDCDDVVIDLSRNRSKRYCEHGCGNRLNVAAYRARQATQ